NLGISATEEIVNERKRGGEFSSLANFCERVRSDVTNKKVLEALIYAGAFDCFGESRRSLLLTMESTLEHGHITQKQRAYGQLSIEDFLFADEDEQTESKPISTTVEFSEHPLSIVDFELFMAEKRALSIYLSGHPLSAAHRFTNGFFPTTKDVYAAPIGNSVQVLGVISNSKGRQTRKQRDMVTFDLEDTKGKIPCVIFQNDDLSFDRFKVYKELLSIEDIYLVSGKLSDFNDSERNIVVSSITPFMRAVEKQMPELKIYLHPKDENVLETLYTIITGNRGELQVKIEIKRDNHIFSINLNGYMVKPSYKFFEALDNAKIDYALTSRRKNEDAAVWDIQSTDDEYLSSKGDDFTEEEDEHEEEFDYSNL
ncbi:MAG: hypothetical protein LBP51_00275, partial [Deferribacteraceae bacterium]|nr:hypothetical protein [Deferribacteraceae bacterium]